MGKQIFVNLPVRDLAKARAFHEALGHTINPKFSDDNAACVVISEGIHVMLLMQPYFQSFTEKKVCDAATHIETLVALSTDSREGVDDLMRRALAAGGTEAGAVRDYGFMYQRSVADPDGHTFELFYMNESEFPGNA